MNYIERRSSCVKPLINIIDSNQIYHHGLAQHAKKALKMNALLSELGINADVILRLVVYLLCAVSNLGMGTVTLPTPSASVSGLNKTMGWSSCVGILVVSL